jgi:hypothetical protein
VDYRHQTTSYTNVTNNVTTHNHNSAVAMVAMVFIAGITSPLWLTAGGLYWLIKTAFGPEAKPVQAKYYLDG